MVDFPVNFSNLPSGFAPLSLFDEAFQDILSKSYFPVVVPGGGTFGDSTHVAQITIGENGFITNVVSVPIAAGAQVIRVVTAAGAVAVAAGDTCIALNLAAPQAGTIINLPAVAGRNGVPLTITDWKGNAGDLTLTPSGTEKVMGLANGVVGNNGQGLGTAATIKLISSTVLGGWIAG